MDTGHIKKVLWIILYPFNYLFFKLYVFFSHMTFSGVPMSHLGFMGALLIINTITVYLGFWNFAPPNWVYVILIAFLLPYSFPKLADNVILKFENESENAKAIGNIIVIFYIVISIVLFVKYAF